MSALSVSVPAAAAPAATTAPTTPWWLAVMVPVTVSVLACAFTVVILTSHVQTVVPGMSVPWVQSLVQTAALQIVSVENITHRSKTVPRICYRGQNQPRLWSSSKMKTGANGPPIAWHLIPLAFYVTSVISNTLIYNHQMSYILFKNRACFREHFITGL